jgi:ABC-type polysaccharide/polyol phosphate export permease
MIRLLSDLRRARHALLGLAYVNLRTTVATTRLGALWWVLDPLFLMLIYYFVVKMVFDRGGEGYHLFALCGIVTFQTFSRSVSLCCSSLTKNSALIKQASLPMVAYVLISPVVQVFFYLIGLVIIVCWNFQAVGWHTLGVLAILPLMVLIPFALGLFLAVFEVYSRDTGKLLSYVMRFGFYLSPVLYAPQRVFDLDFPQWMFMLYQLNPMVHIITWVRDVLLYGQSLNWIGLAVLTAFTLLGVQVALVFFRRMARNVPKRI